MKQPSKIDAIIIDETQTFSIEELSSSSQVEVSLIIEMVDYGLLEPEGAHPEQWLFSSDDLKRSQKALHLKDDLEVNFPGIALVLDLLDEVQELRQELEQLERFQND